MPVPPNTSLPKTTAKAVERATIQSGMSTGMIIRDQQTRHQEALVDLVAAELGECELDVSAPTTYETTIRGSTLRNPNQSEPRERPHALREEVHVTRVIETEQKRR